MKACIELDSSSLYARSVYCDTTCTYIQYIVIPHIYTVYCDTTYIYSIL